MSLQTWQELLYSTIADGVQISNTVTETVMIPDFAIPAKYWYPGRTIKTTLNGVLSCVITTPGTLTVRARFITVAGTVLAASAAIALNVVAQTNASICIEFWHTCRTIGLTATSGSLWTTGRATLGAAHSTTTTPGDMIPATANVVVSSLDLTSANGLSYSAQFSVATAPTNLTINQYLIEAKN